MAHRHRRPQRSLHQRCVSLRYPERRVALGPRHRRRPWVVAGPAVAPCCGPSRQAACEAPGWCFAPHAIAGADGGRPHSGCSARDTQRHRWTMHGRSPVRTVSARARAYCSRRSLAASRSAESAASSSWLRLSAVVSRARSSSNCWRSRDPERGHGRSRRVSSTHPYTPHHPAGCRAGAPSAMGTPATRSPLLALQVAHGVCRPPHLSASSHARKCRDCLNA